MKVRITKRFKTTKGELKEGQIVDVKPSVAEQWSREGKCILLKIIGPTETK